MVHFFFFLDISQTLTSVQLTENKKVIFLIINIILNVFREISWTIRQ